jgi:hypothetical protein
LHGDGAGSCHGLFGVVLDFERILRLTVVEFLTLYEWILSCMELLLRYGLRSCEG